jgi:hypothetical protein
MNLSQVLAFLMTMAPVIEPVLLNIENGTIQPELKKLIAGVTNPELNALLTGIDGALDAFVKTEIGKV